MTIKEKYQNLRKAYRELRESYDSFYHKVTNPNKKELWYYADPMGNDKLRELFISVHSAQVLGYECVIRAEGATTLDKKLHVVFVSKRPEGRPHQLVMSEYVL